MRPSVIKPNLSRGNNNRLVPLLPNPVGKVEFTVMYWEISAVESAHLKKERAPHHESVMEGPRSRRNLRDVMSQFVVAGETALNCKCRPSLARRTKHVNHGRANSDSIMFLHERDQLRQNLLRNNVIVVQEENVIATRIHCPR